MVLMSQEAATLNVVEANHVDARGGSLYTVSFLPEAPARTLAVLVHHHGCAHTFGVDPVSNTVGLLLQLCAKNKTTVALC